MKKFWMVQKLLNMESCPARFKHDSLESAIKEAERLTRKSGEAFLILEATKIVCIENPPVIVKDIIHPMVGKKAKVIKSDEDSFVKKYIGEIGEIADFNDDKKSIEIKISGAGPYYLSFGQYEIVEDQENSEVPF